METNENITPRCFHCGAELIWMCDYDQVEITGDLDDENKIAASYTCPKCGCNYMCYEGEIDQ